MRLGIFLALLITFHTLGTAAQASFSFGVIDTRIQSFTQDSRGRNSVSIEIEFQIWNEVQQPYILLASNNSCSIAFQITTFETFSTCFTQTIIIPKGVFQFNSSFNFEVENPIQEISVKFQIQSAPVGEIFNAFTDQVDQPSNGETKENRFIFPPPEGWGISPSTPNTPLHFRINSIHLTQTFRLIPLTIVTFASTVGAFNEESEIISLSSISSRLGYVNISSQEIEIEQDIVRPISPTAHCFSRGVTYVTSIDTITFVDLNPNSGETIHVNFTFFPHSNLFIPSFPLTVVLSGVSIETMISHIPLKLERLREAPTHRGTCPPNEPTSPLENPVITAGAIAMSLSTLFLVFFAFRNFHRRRKARHQKTLYPTTRRP